MSERFDGRAAWALLTPEEQAEIGRLALEATVCVQASILPHPRLGTERWPLEPEDAIDLVEANLDQVVDAALRRVGVVADDGCPPPPSFLFDLDEER